MEEKNPIKAQEIPTVNETVYDRNKKRIPAKVWIIFGSILFIAVIFGIYFYKENKYNEAMDLLNNNQFTEAREKFESLGNYQDSMEMIKECHYKEVKAKIQNNEYSAVIEIIEAYNLEFYKDSQAIYEDCLYQMDMAKYNELVEGCINMAQQTFSSLENLKDIADELAEKDFDGKKDELEKRSERIYEYFQTAEKVYNDYSQIAYEHILDMSSEQIERYAQIVLGKKYNMPQSQIQHIFECYMDYIGSGGRYVTY